MGKQKVNCKIFTPQNVVVQMLDILGYRTNLFGRKVLENSCGDGRFLIEIVKRYIEDCRRNGYNDDEICLGLERDIFAFEIDIDTYKTCVHNLNEVLANYSLDQVNWSICNEDALKADIPSDFSYVIGNPPYITYSALTVDDRSYLRKKYTVCMDGKPDYYYAFVESALKCLGDDGRLVYLVPSNFFKTRFASKLRDYMLPMLTEIYDYKENKIFNSALTASTIVVCDKAHTSNEVCYHDITKGTVCRMAKDELNGRWIFTPYKSNDTSKKMLRFGDCYPASSSIATLYNTAFIINETEVSLGKIEPQILRKAVSPKSAAYNRREYIIFPYRFDDHGNIQRYSEDEFEKSFPGASAYLQTHKKRLEDRDSDKSALWFEYGRSQAIRHLNKKKLLLSTLSTKRVKVYELDEETIPYSGIYIIANEGFHLSDAKRILESESFFQYVKSIGINANGTSIRISINDINNYRFSDGF